jgi:hypothetical protein
MFHALWAEGARRLARLEALLAIASSPRPLKSPAHPSYCLHAALCSSLCSC